MSCMFGVWGGRDGLKCHMLGYGGSYGRLSLSKGRIIILGMGGRWNIQKVIHTIYEPTTKAHSE